MNHFDEMTCLLYLEGQLDADHAEGVRSHAASCAECRGLLRALQSESVWLRDSLEADDESVPARLVQAPQHGGAPWGWISALGLSAGGAYTAWSGFIEPWRAQAAQAGFTQGNLLTMLFFSGAFWKGWDAMRSLIEFLAMATLGLVVMWLLRRHLRRTTALAVVMGALALMVALPPSAGAAELRHGDPNYTLPAGEVVHTDLIVSADSTRIDGDVEGDLIAFSRSVTVNGHIKGDIIAFSQELRVNGPVDGNVRAFVQNLQLYNTVARNVLVWAGDVNLDQGAKVNGTFDGGNRPPGSGRETCGRFARVFGRCGYQWATRAQRQDSRRTFNDWVAGRDRRADDSPAASAAGRINERETEQPAGMDDRQTRIRNQLFFGALLRAPDFEVGREFPVWAGAAVPDARLIL